MDVTLPLNFYSPFFIAGCMNGVFPSVIRISVVLWAHSVHFSYAPCYAECHTGQFGRRIIVVGKWEVMVSTPCYFSGHVFLR